MDQQNGRSLIADAGDAGLMVREADPAQRRRSRHARIAQSFVDSLEGIECPRKAAVYGHVLAQRERLGGATPQRSAALTWVLS